MNISLHPERGIDPHMTFCPRCGGDAEELTLGYIVKIMYQGNIIGYADRGAIGISKKKIAKALSISVNQLSTEVVGEHERVQASQPCVKCVEKIRLHASVVAEGGIYFKCAACGKAGVIKLGSFARAVRDACFEMGLIKSIDEPCGIEFVECSEHEV